MKIAITCIQLIRDISMYREALISAGLDIVLPQINGQHLEGDELIQALEGCEGVIAGDDQFTREVLSRCSDLKVISKWGIGIDGIDLAAAKERKIKVTNTPGEFNNEVADVTMAYCVMLLRHLHQINEEVRQGNWLKPPGNSLVGKSFGIVGLGGIGLAVADRAASFGMKIIGVDPSEQRQKEAALKGVQIMEIDELVRSSDVISINCPLTTDTFHMFNKELFKKMKRGAWLINVGRGGVIETEALIEALEEQKIAGADLDVLEVEPLPKNSPLLKFKNVIFGSHNASNTFEASERVHVRSIQNLADALGIKVDV